MMETEVENPIDGQVEKKVEDLLEEEVEKIIEGEVEETADKPIKKRKRAVIGIIIALCMLLVFYFAMALYFRYHFYVGSEINGINISMKSIEDVEVLMASELQVYTLSLKERGRKSEQVKAADVGLRYESDEVFKELKDSQNPFSWMWACFNTEDYKMTVEVTYDEKLLKERIDRLSCFKSTNIIEPKNPSFQYVNNRYVIVDEVLGNEVDKDLLFSYVKDVLRRQEIEIELEAIDAYIKPQYHSKSQEMIEVKDTLNQYVSSKITYVFGNSEEVLEAFTINKWLTVDENFRVVVDEKKIGDYIDGLSEKYNTKGRIRNFTTSLGKTIQIGGGDFSRPIHKAEEIHRLISVIKEGKTITKEPIYGETGFYEGNSDMGDTYVEIDLTNQHIWFYKKGSLVVEGDIVTGNVSAGHTTPPGVYSLKYKVKNVVLRGPGYASPVDFWMPFNGGIGMHDASWRSVFGGNIYKTNGSHGCINCPRNVASAIYNEIEPDTPIICY